MRIKTRYVILTVLSLALIHRQSPAQPSAPPEAREVVIDATAPAHPFPHFWEQMFGSGRAILSLRDSYRHDLREVKQITGFEYVRFHAIFHDEVGVYDEDAQGQEQLNFSYVDQIYDGLLAAGVRPFVELSFMPKKLAAQDLTQAFWYRPVVSPPKDWNKWDDLITRFSKHLVDRYGINEVSQWYFEVWNEPNIDFWAGQPRQSTYWDLYDHTARALKQVSPLLRVGGPATAQAAWADAFIRHCVENKVPVDFVSSHVYGNDSAKDVFGSDHDEKIPRDQMVCRAVRKVHDQIRASTMPDLPLIWTEYNASYFNEPGVTDSIYMAPWMADTIRQCDGLTEMMSYWTFSDVFEEQGVVKQPFYGGFGLIAEGGIPKPSYNAFQLLHLLGDQRLSDESDSVLVTRRPDGSLVIAAWNLLSPEPTRAAGTAQTETELIKNGPTRTIHLRFEHLTGHRRAYISRVDRDHGDVHPAYEKMGQPRDPTPDQLKTLQQAAQLPPAEIRELTDSGLTFDLSPEALAVIEIK
jgi:xylan 1,4-beta-xylosidase